MYLCVGRMGGLGKEAGKGDILGPSNLHKYLYKTLITCLRVSCFKV